MKKVFVWFCGKRFQFYPIRMLYLTHSLFLFSHWILTAFASPPPSTATLVVPNGNSAPSSTSVHSPLPFQVEIISRLLKAIFMYSKKIIEDMMTFHYQNIFTYINKDFFYYSIKTWINNLGSFPRIITKTKRGNM